MAGTGNELSLGGGRTSTDRISPAPHRIGHSIRRSLGGCNTTMGRLLLVGGSMDSHDRLWTGYQSGDDRTGRLVGRCTHLRAKTR